MRHDRCDATCSRAWQLRWLHACSSWAGSAVHTLRFLHVCPPGLQLAFPSSGTGSGMRELGYYSPEVSVCPAQ